MKIFVTTVRATIPGEDEEHVGHFATEIAPDFVARYTEQDLGVAIDGGSIAVELHEGDGAAEIGAWLRSLTPAQVATADKMTGRVNELERGMRNIERMLSQVLAARETPAVAARVVAQAIAPEPAENHAQTPIPTGRRDRPGATPEMSSGKMDLVGPAPTSQIFTVGANANGEVDTVKVRLPRVGDSLKPLAQRARDDG